MKVAILILENVLKSTAFGIEELFDINNNFAKSKDEEEIQTEFISF